MEETTVNPEVQNETAEVKTETPVAESTEPTKPLTEEEQLEVLKATRLGKFKVALSVDELKYINNYFKSDVPFTGANEAYLVTTTTFALAQAIPTGKVNKEENITTELPATTIEAISYFLNKKEGKGEQSARRLFGIVFKLQPTINQIQQISAQIQALTNKGDIEKESKS